MATHVSQMYPCSEVTLPCELYYIIELGKYLTYYHEEPISVKGVIFAEGLERSKIWQYLKIAIEAGWVVDTGLSKELTSITYNNELTITTTDVLNLLLTTEECSFDAIEHEKRKDADYALRTPKLTPISFARQSSDGWLWNIGGKDNKNLTKNNKILGTLSEQSIVSLIAYVAVSRAKTGQPTELLLEFDFQSLILPMTLAYYMLLSEETPALKGWVTLHIDESVSHDDALQIGYAGWYIKGKDQGDLARQYSISEKKSYMKKHDIEVGDLMLMYKRKARQHNNYFKGIESCRVCRILSLTDRHIEIEYFNTVKTYAQGYCDFASYSKEVQRMYLEKPYEKLNTTIEKLDIGEVGVGYYLYGEEYLLLPLCESYDIKVQCVDINTPDVQLILEQNELIYWILMDYGYEFDRERYLAKNFKQRTPLYDKYHKGDYIEQHYYYHYFESESENQAG